MPSSSIPGIMSNMWSKIKSPQSPNEASKISYCQNFEPKVMRIVCVPEQLRKGGANHNFCGFIVSEENDGLVGIVKMTKICRQNDDSSIGNFPAIKVHFVSELLPGF